MSWSTAFVQTTESSRNLNYRGTQLQDQLSRFQFTQTKLPFLNQLGISFEKPRAAWAGAFPAVLQWEVEQWPGSVNNSVCEGLPSDRHIQLLQVPLRVRAWICLQMSFSQPGLHRALSCCRIPKRSSQDLFLGPGNAPLSFLLCFYCCPTYPGVFAARILQLYRAIRESESQYLLSCPSQERPGKCGLGWVQPDLIRS